MSKTVDSGRDDQPPLCAQIITQEEEPAVASSSLEGNGEALDPTRSHLIANLVHDLRTPLVSIRGYTKMVLEERAGPITSTQKEYLTIAVENTNKVVQLLNNLQQVAESQPLRFEVFDMRELLQDSSRAVRDQAIGNSGKIEERIPSEAFFVFGDKQKLTEVFTSLLSDAIKGAQGGDVSVELSGGKRREVAISISHKAAEISGASLGKTSMNRDQPCNDQRLASRSATGETLGADFTAIQDIIRLHGGQFSLSDNTGEGVAYSITIPAL